MQTHFKGPVACKSHQSVSSPRVIQADLPRWCGMAKFQQKKENWLRNNKHAATKIMSKMGCKKQICSSACQGLEHDEGMGGAPFVLPDTEKRSGTAKPMDLNRESCEKVKLSNPSTHRKGAREHCPGMLCKDLLRNGHVPETLGGKGEPLTIDVSSLNHKGITTPVVLVDQHGNLKRGPFNSFQLIIANLSTGPKGVDNSGRLNSIVHLGTSSAREDTRRQLQKAKWLRGGHPRCGQKKQWSTQLCNRSPQEE